MNLNSNNNDSSTDHSIEQSYQQSPIRLLVFVKHEKGVTAPDVTSIVHWDSSMGGNDTATAGSNNGNTITNLSSPLPTPISPLCHRPSHSLNTTPVSGDIEIINLISPLTTLVGTLHPRDNNHPDSNNNKVSTALDICLQKETYSRQALIFKSSTNTRPIKEETKSKHNTRKNEPFVSNQPIVCASQPKTASPAKTGKNT